MTDSYDDIHTNENLCTVTYLTLTELFTEDTIESNFKVKGNGSCKIAVYEKEGPIPHFHIENNDKSFVCCIRLDKPEYFIHGTKNKKLISSDIKRLIKVLMTEDRELKMTNFEYACYLWNKHTNSNNKLKKPYKMPDYTKLND